MRGITGLGNAEAREKIPRRETGLRFGLALVDVDRSDVGPVLIGAAGLPFWKGFSDGSGAIA